MVVHDAVHDGLQLLTEEDREDRGRRLLRAEAVVISGKRDRAAQKLLILVHALDERRQEQQKPRVLARRAARREQVVAGIGGERPVVVLAAAVHAREGLFVQQADQPVPLGDPFHDLHRELILVVCGIGVGVDRRHLMLRRRDLVVLGLGQDAKLPKLLVQLLHICRDARADGAEIVVVQLLPLGRSRAEKRPAAQAQILAPEVKLLVDEEILLLRADLGKDLLRLVVSEQAQDAHGLTADGVDGAQQRRLFVERLAGIGAENGRDAEAAVLDEGEGGGVPSGVASGLKRGAQAAGGEGGGVRLAADELLAGEVHNDPSAADGVDEAVVLLGGHAGERLEPVGEMGRAVLQRPDLHAVGDVVCDVERKRRARRQTFLPCLKCRTGDILLHCGLVKNVASKQFRDLFFRLHEWFLLIIKI